jgi:hypothetical protein
MRCQAGIINIESQQSDHNEPGQCLLDLKAILIKV